MTESSIDIPFQIVSTEYNDNITFQRLGADDFRANTTQNKSYDFNMRFDLTKSNVFYIPKNSAPDVYLYGEAVHLFLYDNSDNRVSASYRVFTIPSNSNIVVSDNNNYSKDITITEDAENACAVWDYNMSDADNTQYVILTASNSNYTRPILKNVPASILNVTREVDGNLTVDKGNTAILFKYNSSILDKMTINIYGATIINNIEGGSEDGGIHRIAFYHLDTDRTILITKFVHCHGRVIFRNRIEPTNGGSFIQAITYPTFGINRSVGPVEVLSSDIWKCTEVVTFVSNVTNIPNTPDGRVYYVTRGIGKDLESNPGDVNDLTVVITQTALLSLGVDRTFSYNCKFYFIVNKRPEPDTDILKHITFGNNAEPIFIPEVTTIDDVIDTPLTSTAPGSKVYIKNAKIESSWLYTEEVEIKATGKVGTYIILDLFKDSIEPFFYFNYDYNFEFHFGDFYLPELEDGETVTIDDVYLRTYYFKRCRDKVDGNIIDDYEPFTIHGDFYIDGGDFSIPEGYTLNFPDSVFHVSRNVNTIVMSGTLNCKSFIVE